MNNIDKAIQSFYSPTTSPDLSPTEITDLVNRMITANSKDFEQWKQDLNLPTNPTTNDKKNIILELQKHLDPGEHNDFFDELKKAI